MGNIGERFGVGVKVIGTCFLLWLVGDLLTAVATRLNVDLAWLVNGLFFILLCFGGWLFLRWSDGQKQPPK